jgi:hypothetical protein
MQPADETVDDATRDQLKIIDLGQYFRVDKALSRYLPADFSLSEHRRLAYMPELGNGTVSTRRSMMSSVLTFSDSA